MRVCIHRCTKQIGGTCVEIEASGSRIIVDLGLPLEAVDVDPALVPQIPGLREHDPSQLAIVLSHGHRDHWGLVPKVRPHVPIVMGKGTERIMRAAADFDASAPKFADQRLGWVSLSRGNVGGSHIPGNRIAETALAGWDGSNHKEGQNVFFCRALVEYELSIYRQKYRHFKRLGPDDRELSRTSKIAPGPLEFA
jgi:Metallo-beta-lactamase superfamily